MPANNTNTSGGIVFPSILGLIATIFCLGAAYLEYSQIGFPDGYMTRFDHQAKSILYPIFFIICGIFMIIFGRALFFKKPSKSILAGFIFFLVFYIFFCYYLYIVSAAGKGG